MTQREKLIELIIASVDGCARHWAEIIADYLLANGVTVDEKPIIIHEPTSSEFCRMAIQEDYVKVIRCEDCDYSDYFLMKHGVVYCYKIGREVNSGFFCADGERRTDETD